MRTRLIIIVCLVLLIIACSVHAETLFKGSEPVPSDAIVLFDGKDISQWVQCGSDNPAGWKVENGCMQVRGGNICTKRKFTDFQLHVEFWLPLMAEAKGQARANSGVYLQGRYEIQVLDSYGLKPEMGDCGAAYGASPPMVNACRPPENWQTYDIIYHAPKFDDKGNQTTGPRATVFQNGVLIHLNAEWPKMGIGALGGEANTPGAIMLQDHGCAVRYRNVWIRPL